MLASEIDRCGGDGVGEADPPFPPGRGFPNGVRRIPAEFLETGRARTLVSVAVLPPAIDIVRNLVIDRDMVHLGNRTGHPLPGLAPVGGDHGAAVVADYQAGPLFWGTPTV